MKNIILLGASGSIGTQALDVIKENMDKYKVVKISIGYNIDLLKKILRNFSSIKEVALLDESEVMSLKQDFSDIKFYVGSNGILSLLDNGDYDLVLNAIVGFDGLLPSIKTIESKKILALANKETMVVAGAIINNLLKEYPESKIVPVDSEHCAIFQCLENGKSNEVKRLIISASGGSFRDKTLEELQDVTIKDALNHPNWDMGASITIDSATMLNKGLEVIEAHWLFNIEYDNIDVVIHRESIVHSMVEYCDSSIIAQLSMPNMRQPIVFAFAHPNRIAFKDSSIDFSKMLSLSFTPVDFTRFKGLKLAYDAGRLAHSYPCVLNASKEVASQAFLDGKIAFIDIVDYVEKALDNHTIIKNPTINDLIDVDNNTRKYVSKLIEKGSIDGDN